MLHLVTGAAGFIGSHLSEKLLRQGHDVVGLDNMNAFYDPEIKQSNLLNIETVAAQAGREFIFYAGDIRQQNLLSQIFSQHKIDTVYHLAAMAGVRPSAQNPRLYIDVNEQGSVNILEEMRAHHLRKIVFASSSSVYGNAVKVPFSESDNVDFPISIYAATKKAGELLTHTYHSLYGFSVACLRFFTVYGPRQRPDLAIHAFAKKILAGQPVPIFGDGSKSRDFTYIDDIVDGIVRAGAWTAQTDEARYGIFNLGESKTISVLDMIAALEKAIGKTAKKNFLPDVPGDVQTTFADITKAKTVLGYNPQTTFPVGLARFVEWLRPADASH